ncbi:hypothetical protein [uncultured Winogradskyella sp.]|uniref:hypothetical protein n=1 Tax=uncultured Winogradskyella sp. TaxID=395353 RepID=UPI0026162FA5|nr:hypothetical protein [uncultured Winogradskyella sp.]
METKTHYRNIAKSDHLGVADLEDFNEKNIPLVFTIKEVKQELKVKVAGRTGDFNIAYFIQNIIDEKGQKVNVKPLVLNVTNAKIVSTFNPTKENPKGSPFVEDWSNTKIQLYIDPNVKMKGEVVGGVRINPMQPKEAIKKPFTEANFEPAKKANATIEMIKKSYSLTPEMEEKYLEYVA